MADVTITVRDNGPYRVTGEIELVDAEGNRFKKRARYSLCRCGASSNKPFCDGSHKDIGFEDQTRAE